MRKDIQDESTRFVSGKHQVPVAHNSGTMKYLFIARRCKEIITASSLQEVLNGMTGAGRKIMAILQEGTEIIIIRIPATGITFLFAGTEMTAARLTGEIIMKQDNRIAGITGELNEGMTGTEILITGTRTPEEAGIFLIAIIMGATITGRGIITGEQEDLTAGPINRKQIHPARAATEVTNAEMFLKETGIIILHPARPTGNSKASRVNSTTGEAATITVNSSRVTAMPIAGGAGEEEGKIFLYEAERRPLGVFFIAGTAK